MPWWKIVWCVGGVITFLILLVFFFSFWKEELRLKGYLTLGEIVISLFIVALVSFCWVAVPAAFLFCLSVYPVYWLLSKVFSVKVITRRN